MSALPTIQEIAASVKAAAAAAAPAEPAPVEAAPEAPAEEGEVVSAAEVSPASAEEVKKDPMASRFAALTRKEKEIRQREKDAEARAKAAEDREKLAEERAARVADREAKLEMIKKTPYKALKEQGLTLQDVINDSLNQYDAPKEDPVAQLQKKLEELEKAPNSKVEALEKQVSDLINKLQDKEYQSAISEVTESLTSVVTGAPDSYELMAQYGDEGIDLAKEVIREYYQQNQKLLSYTEACDIVEKHYESEVLDRVMKTKKAQSRLAAQEAPKAATKPANPTKEAIKPNTLTSKVATASSEVKVDIDKLPRDQAIAYLAKQFKTN